MVFLQGGKPRFLLVFSHSDLSDGAKTTNTDGDRFATFWIGAQYPLAHLLFRPGGRLFNGGVERRVKVPDYLVPGYVALGYLVELLLDGGRKVEIKDIGK
ncbi:MAG: hypothetical protein BWY72_02175 [Bacteroidetes bacterium ADurb.Bin416]|nr:MAG: hypothetical protein BWY72_02175 [Bacteroidetes bacterium ADurb.Bin416]